MTNVEIALVTISGLTSASASVGFCLLHKKLSSMHRMVDQEFDQVFETARDFYTSTKVGVRTEARDLQLKLETEAGELHSKIDSVLEYVGTHAETLKTHAEDLRNHAKNITDVASAAKFAITRQAPTR